MPQTRITGRGRRIGQTWRCALALLGLLLLPMSHGAETLADRILPLRERAAVRDDILRDRLDTVVPMLMRREGIAAWLLISREYNEDPVLETMLPATWLSARRRTMLLFIDHGEPRGVERMAISRYAVGDLFPGVWDPETQPDQWQRLAQLLTEFDPGSIALNTSTDFGLADGLTYTEFAELREALPDQLASRLTSAENLAVGWLETRTSREMAIYADVMAIAHDIIREGFSARVVTAGQTSIEDLEWWFDQRTIDLGLSNWFHTGIEVERSDQSQDEIERLGRDPQLLWPGDHVHIDFGISYLGLKTDTQQNAYILRAGENDVPDALKFALRQGNALQDLLTDNFAVGRTGNEILRRTREDAIASGIQPIIYTHPIGLHGHAAGTTIGLWDQQQGVPGRGDYPMQSNTAYSIELTALVEVPEWSTSPMRMKLEEDGFFDGASFHYIRPRQTEYHIIDPAP